MRKTKDVIVTYGFKQMPCMVVVTDYDNADFSYCVINDCNTFQELYYKVLKSLNDAGYSVPYKVNCNARLYLIHWINTNEHKYNCGNPVRMFFTLKQYYSDIK